MRSLPLRIGGARNLKSRAPMDISDESAAVKALCVGAAKLIGLSDQLCGRERHLGTPIITALGCTGVAGAAGRYPQGEQQDCAGEIKSECVSRSVGPSPTSFLDSKVGVHDSSFTGEFDRYSSATEIGEVAAHRLRARLRSVCLYLTVPHPASYHRTACADFDVSTIFAAREMGTAKFEPEKSDRIAKFTPITFPLPLNTGPPDPP